MNQVSHTSHDFWLLVLGAFLSFAGGLIAFFVQSYWNKKQQERIVLEFLSELLRAFDRIAPRIVETFEKSGTLWNDLLNQVNNDLMVYERNKEHAVIINDKALRAEVWDWFSKLRTDINYSLGLNNMIAANPNNAWARDEVRKQPEKINKARETAQTLLKKLSS